MVLSHPFLLQMNYSFSRHVFTIKTKKKCALLRMVKLGSFCSAKVCSRFFRLQESRGTIVDLLRCKLRIVFSASVFALLLCSAVLKALVAWGITKSATR